MTALASQGAAEPGSGGSGLPRHAKSSPDGQAHAGHPDARGFHTQLQAGYPQMVETAGVSRSAVSRAAIQASQAEIEALVSRRFEDLKLLAIYIGGLVFGDYSMVGAVGVDSEGYKQVLCIREGATENSTVLAKLLEDIVSRGVDPKREMLFVIDGPKALCAAINAVFGTEQAVQRCRAHKLHNVLDYLPKDDRAQVKVCCERSENWMPTKASHGS